MTRLLLALLTGVATGLPALAHDGHGLPGESHWHASDLLGFVLVVAAAAWALWRAGRK